MAPERVACELQRGSRLKYRPFVSFVVDPYTAVRLGVRVAKGGCEFHCAFSYAATRKFVALRF